MSHADFDYSFVGGSLEITDLNLGNKSVTNDAEYVLSFIRKVEGSKVENCIITYQDSDEMWCKMLPTWKDGKCINVDFAPLQYERS